MKNILVALAMAGLTSLSAQAQTDNIKSCEVKQNQVCTKGHACYPTKYAENFKVCKGDRGYFICCETPGENNATHSGYAVTTSNQNEENTFTIQDGYVQNEAPQDAASVLPQSQSYPGYEVMNSNSYEGYYLKKSKQRPCYGGNNVAEQNQNPYHGCPSPQFDGPEKNNYRNMNVVTQ